jgi:hypothetical protein
MLQEIDERVSSKISHLLCLPAQAGRYGISLGQRSSVYVSLEKFLGFAYLNLF